MPSGAAPAISGAAFAGLLVQPPEERGSKNWYELACCQLDGLASVRARKTAPPPEHCPPDPVVQRNAKRYSFPLLKIGDPRASCGSSPWKGSRSLNTRVIDGLALVAGLYSARPKCSVLMPPPPTHTSTKLISSFEPSRAAGSRATPVIQVAEKNLPGTLQAFPSGSTTCIGAGRKCSGARVLGRCPIAAGGVGTSLRSVGALPLVNGPSAAVDPGRNSPFGLSTLGLRVSQKSQMLWPGLPGSCWLK